MRTNDIALLLGRILLSLLFVIMGSYKVGAYDTTLQNMAHVGLPEILLPFVIILEIGGGTALIFGWQTKAIAMILAIFSLLTAFLFHTDFGNLNEFINFLKNLSIAGGLLCIFSYGAGYFSIDALRARSAIMSKNRE